MSHHPSKEDALKYWFEIWDHIPRDRDNKESKNNFKNSSDKYAKCYGRLSWADQGWVSEQISNHLKFCLGDVTA